MKKIDDIKTWFIEKINSCYTVKTIELNDSILLYYDENFIRNKKISNIVGVNYKYPTKPRGECLFEINFKKKYFYYSYSIRDYLFEHCIDEIHDNDYIIKNILIESEKFKDLEIIESLDFSFLSLLTNRDNFYIDKDFIIKY